MRRNTNSQSYATGIKVFSVKAGQEADFQFNLNSKIRHPAPLCKSSCPGRPTMSTLPQLQRGGPSPIVENLAAYQPHDPTLMFNMYINPRPTFGPHPGPVVWPGDTKIDSGINTSASSAAPTASASAAVPPSPSAALTAAVASSATPVISTPP
ncbi:uncharacterized protein Z518_07993 [Rhinocladiella mackenziei CBS 650.93]|uniref:Uncharacterized protein n=1 Tax=Rhinocladiella mackenziei CBS 650.93 TaxID=1442369 RepID=A0A0D2I886_9EURO|nr:uncharacterized protein Z518_07993 [Rhinocladiella mackenziei CBS 650.93]KIX02054.1 hypothetical protein Z518_07993 [Rhinocladiella mackenziei CBS 650.93]